MNFFDKNYRASDILDGVGFNQWKLKILSHEEFSQLSIIEQLQYFCSFGLLASTTHNSSPERFKVHQKNNSIEIFLDRKSILPESDPTGRQAVLSIGCVIENIVIVSRYYALHPRIQLNKLSPDQVTPYKQKEERYVTVGTIFLTKNDTSSDLSLVQTILKRKVLRAEYDPTIKVENTITNELSETMKKDFPDIQLVLIEDKPTIQQIGKYQELADRTVFEKKAFTKELGAWLLPNTDKNKVGIQGKDFGFDDTFALHIHEGLLQKKRLLPDEIAGFATAGKFLMNSSPAVGIISVQQDSIEHWVEAGRAYERISLLLIGHNFFTAVHAAIVEVERVKRMLRVALKTQHFPVMIFRIGKPILEKDGLRPHSARPPLEEILL